MAELWEIIRQVPVFRHFACEDLRLIAPLCTVRNYQRGGRIFSEGDPSDTFYTIIRGRVKVFKTTPTGKEIIIELFGAGDPFGAVAVLEQRPFPASVVALEDTVCLLIPSKSFFNLIERNPSFVRGLLLGLTHRLIELTRRISELTGMRVEPRLARLFLKFADEVGRPSSGHYLIPAKLSRQELADLAGTTIETCIRIMSRWQKQDIVHTVRDGFVILNRRQLEEISSL